MTTETIIPARPHRLPPVVPVEVFERVQELAREPDAEDWVDLYVPELYLLATAQLHAGRIIAWSVHHPLTRDLAQEMLELRGQHLHVLRLTRGEAEH